MFLYNEITKAILKSFFNRYQLLGWYRISSLFQVDTDPSAFNRYRPVDVAVCGSASKAVEAIQGELRAQGHAAAHRWFKLLLGNVNDDF